MMALAATPAFANEAVPGNSKAVWIALGVTFTGAFFAIFGSLIAALGSKKKSADKQ